MASLSFTNTRRHHHRLTHPPTPGSSPGFQKDRMVGSHCPLCSIILTGTPESFSLHLECTVWTPELPDITFPSWRDRPHQQLSLTFAAGARCATLSIIFRFLFSQLFSLWTLDFVALWKNDIMTIWRVLFFFTNNSAFVLVLKICNCYSQLMLDSGP